MSATDAPYIPGPGDPNYRPPTDKQDACYEGHDRGYQGCQKAFGGCGGVGKDEKGLRKCRRQRDDEMQRCLKDSRFKKGGGNPLISAVVDFVFVFTNRF